MSCAEQDCCRTCCVLLAQACWLTPVSSHVCVLFFLPSFPVPQELTEEERRDAFKRTLARMKKVRVGGTEWWQSLSSS